jgi:hypothetical protein
LLGELHQGPEAGGIDEVDATQIDDHRQIGAFALVGDEIPELLVGVSVELAGEAEQQTTFLPFATPAQGDSQSLQVRDCSSPRNSGRAEV